MRDLGEDPAVSELFGHAKGAFTGASHSSGGRFKQAEGGTLVLDEIAELSLRVQAMLLRAIDKKAVTGHGQPERAVNVRLLAATLEPLPQAVATGRFRRDLWFRLAGQIIEIPPLRDRMPELPALCSAILGTIDEGLTLHEGGGHTRDCAGAAPPRNVAWQRTRTRDGLAPRRQAG